MENFRYKQQFLDKCLINGPALKRSKIVFLTIEVTQQLTPTLVSSGPIVSLCFLSAIQETKGFELFQVTQTFANLHLLSLKETPLVKEFKFMFDPDLKFIPLKLVH